MRHLLHHQPPLWKTAFRFHSFLPRIRPFSMQSNRPPLSSPPHSNGWKVSGENPALFPRRPSFEDAIGGFWSKLAFSVRSFLPKGAADKKAKPPIKRQILGSPDVLAVLLHWQLFLLLAPNNRGAGQISTFHKISVQLLLNIMRQREHFSEFFSPKIHPFRVEMTQGICGCWLFSQISLNGARPPTIRQPALKMLELAGDKCRKCPLMSAWKLTPLELQGLLMESVFKHLLIAFDLYHFERSFAQNASYLEDARRMNWRHPRNPRPVAEDSCQLSTICCQIIFGRWSE